MGRGPQLPAWWRTVEAVEEHQDLRRRHRATGRVSREEEQREEEHLRAVVLAAAVDCADCQSLAQAIARGGPESGHAGRMLRARARRQPTPLFGERPDPEPPAGAVAA